MSAPTLQHLDTLRRIWTHPRVGREEIVAFRNRRLRQMVDYASRNIPFYRELFARAGLNARDLRTAEDLRQLPISSAQDFRSLPAEQILSPRFNAAKLVSRPTSGTSGRPFTVRRGAIEEHLLNCFRLRAEAQYGVRRQDTQAVVAFISRSHRRKAWPGSLRQKLGLYRRFGVACLGSADSECDADLRATVILEAITLPDGSTPEDHGWTLTFDSGKSSPNPAPIPVPAFSQGAYFILVLALIGVYAVARKRLRVDPF